MTSRFAIAHAFSLATLAYLTLLGALAIAAENPRAFPFGRVGAAPQFPWEPLDLPRKISRAPAQVIDEDGATVLRVSASTSAGGALVRMAPTHGAQLEWRWKVDHVVAAADLATRAGDDFAARVYVMFDYPIEKLPFAERMKARVARLFYDKPLPLATLCYVWDNSHPRGSITPSAYTDRVRLIVLRNGSDNAGQWQAESRDLDADFRAAFGEAAPPVIAIAYAVDTDNTASAATAWFGAPTLRGP